MGKQSLFKKKKKWVEKQMIIKDASHINNEFKVN